MKKSSMITLQIFIIQCFWALQAHVEPIQPITLYCHGVGGNKSQISDYKDQILAPYDTVSFPDTDIPQGVNLNKLIYYICSKYFKKEHINRAAMYMGQGKDVESIRQKIKPAQPYILYGLCRGGAAIINYLAQYNPTNIAAIVLDEVPGNMFDIVKKILKPKKKQTPIQEEQTFRWFFPAYPRGVKQAMHNIIYIKNKALPIFLVYANRDTTFHFPSSTWKNYIQFKKHGFTNVYLCELKDCSQNAQGQDKITYLTCLHSFYKHHNLPYDATYATLSKEDLQKLQPSVTTIQQKLQAAAL